MELPETVEDFIEYIQDNGKPWIEADLIPDAPEKAKKAYQNWKKQEKKLIEKGIVT
jgi:beta-xylosidase